MKRYLLILALFSCAEPDEVQEPLDCDCKLVTIEPYMITPWATSWKVVDEKTDSLCLFNEGIHFLDSNDVYIDYVTGRYKIFSDCDQFREILDNYGYIKWD